MSFPLLQAIELLCQVQMGLQSEEDKLKQSAYQALDQFIVLSSDAVLRSGELAQTFRETSQNMRSEALLLKDEKHNELLRRMNEYNQMVKDEEEKIKVNEEHEDLIQQLQENAKRMREQSMQMRDCAQKISENTEALIDEEQKKTEDTNRFINPL